MNIAQITDHLDNQDLIAPIKKLLTAHVPKSKHKIVKKVLTLIRQNKHVPTTDKRCVVRILKNKDLLPEYLLPKTPHEQILVANAQSMLEQKKHDFNDFELEFVPSFINHYKKFKKLSAKQIEVITQILAKYRFLYHHKEKKEDELVDELHEMNMQHFRTL